MTYSNPLQALMQFGQMGQSNNPMQQLQNLMQNAQNTIPQNQPINQQQFIQKVSQIDQQTLAGLVNQARQQGISEQDIETGLNFLQQLCK